MHKHHHSIYRQLYCNCRLRVEKVKVKVKVKILAIVLLTRELVARSALQSGEWQLIGMS